MYSSEQRLLRVGVEGALGKSDAQLETSYFPLIQRAMRRYYGATEGQQVFWAAAVYNGLTTNCGSGCSGSTCDVCFTNRCGAPYAGADVCGSTPSPIKMPGRTDCSFFKDYFLVHEMAHHFLCDPDGLDGHAPDEYCHHNFGAPNEEIWYYCLHSLMSDAGGAAENTNNFCFVDQNNIFSDHHSLSADPWCPPETSSPYDADQPPHPVWAPQIYTPSVPDFPNFTPDNFSFADHDFAGFLFVYFGN